MKSTVTNKTALTGRHIQSAKRVARGIAYIANLRNIESSWWFQSLWKILINWDDYSQYMENTSHVPVARNQ